MAARTRSNPIMWAVAWAGAGRQPLRRGPQWHQPLARRPRQHAERPQGGPMTDRPPPPRASLPGTPLLRTAGACDLDPHHLVEVFGEQRHRFTAVLQGFGPG